MKQILIVEDEPSIATLIQYNLSQEGYKTTVANDGLTAVSTIKKNSYDLVILDVMLPEMDGMQVCKTVRAENNEVPILMLTAKASEDNRIKGLELGVDDYVTKPFSPKELKARVKAILKRTDRGVSSIVAGKFKIYPDRYEAYLNENLLKLKKKEFELLLYLICHKNETVSRKSLLQSIWGYDFIGESRMIDVQVSNLREKIEPNTRNPIYLKTVRGLGYVLEVNK